MKDMRKLAIAIIFVGLASTVIGAISRILCLPIFHLESRVFGGFAVICLLLSINLLLLEKKP